MGGTVRQPRDAAAAAVVGVSAAGAATLLVVADSMCARRGDTSESAQADRLMTAFPGRWTQQQAVTIVDCASKLACGQPRS